MMKKKNKKQNLITRAANGELIYSPLNSHLKSKYKSDTLFDSPFIPYFVVLFCATVDLTIFLNLFSLISYDSPFLLATEIGGLLFGFDFVPIFLAIHIKRVQQKLSKDRIVIWLALGVFVLACLTNTVLRLLTMDLLAPSSADADSYLGTVTQNGSEITPAVIALTLFSIVLPIITSCGSFFVSLMTYKPLEIKKKRLETEINQLNDNIRRLDAILSEYETDEDYAEHLIKDDTGRFKTAKEYEKALLVSYCEYVRTKMKEHLNDNPTAINSLSSDDLTIVLLNLDQTMKALQSSDENTDDTYCPQIQEVISTEVV